MKDSLESNEEPGLNEDTSGKKLKYDKDNFHLRPFLQHYKNIESYVQTLDLDSNNYQIVSEDAPIHKEA